MNLATRVKSRNSKACLVLLILASGAFSGVSAATEEEVRAALLFQLAQYVNWPVDLTKPANSPIRFCVLGQDRLIVTLESVVKGKLIQGRPISIQMIKSASQLASCDLAFLSFHSEKQKKAILTKSHYPAVLLVGETENFAEMGGMVNLVIQSGRVSFEINVAAVEKAHVELRSQLLRFAHLVAVDTEKGKKR